MTVQIGTSGWSYNHWQGVLYPRGATSLERLDAYAEKFTTVEVNNTFYRWPRDEVFEIWRQRVPERFVFTIKASRVLSHMKKLNDPLPSIERMEQGLNRLGDKRGVLLVQLPPFWGCDVNRLDAFLSLVPNSQRVAVEFRHPSWQTATVYETLGRHGAAYCVMSGAGLPCVLRATAPFVYLRFHGPDPEHLYAGSYSDADLWWWAERILEWRAQRRDVYAYFNNDDSGYAVQNALRLREMLGV